MAAVLDPSRALLAFGLLALSGLGASCTAEPALSVELVTDLTAGKDFDGIYLEHAQEELPDQPRCGGTDLFESDRNYRKGVQVGTARHVQSGETWVVRVALCKNGSPVMYRAVKAKIEADTELRVVMALSCFESQCDREGPCDYQRCEPSIECHWGDMHACEKPVCGHAGLPHCAAGQECVVTDCLRGLTVDAGVAGRPDGGSNRRMDAATSPPDDAGLDAQEAEVETDVADAVAEASGEASPAQDDAQADAEAGSAPVSDAQPDGDVVVPPSPSNKARVLYVGDALASETQGKLRWWLGLSSSVDLAGVVGGRVAICDFLETGAVVGPLASKLTQQIKEQKPHLIVLQFWGDALTPCMAEVAADPQAVLDRYKADAEELVRQIERSASAAAIPRPKILWVLQGPEPDPVQRERPRALNQIYQELAGRWGDRTSDAGRPVSMEVYPFDNAPRDRYQWAQHMPCMQFELDDRTRAEQAGTIPDCVAGQGPLLGLDFVRLHRDGADVAHSFAGKVLFCLDTTNTNFECTSSTPGKDPAMPGANRYALRIAGDANAWLGIK